LRIRSQALGIVKIDATSEAIVMQFAKELPIDPASIIRLLQRRKDARMAGPDRIRFSIQTDDYVARIRVIREILSALTP
jgi:transcription-repair coupling factor (superfamily II helicase)